MSFCMLLEISAQGAQLDDYYKLDMSKAYVRVERNFLEVMMLKFGVCQTWINLIMTYVKTVSFTVMVNRVEFGPFNAQRGLRQCDPLTPCLSHLC